MTYEDPRSGRERNLGQDDVGSSTGSWIAGLIAVAAIALGGWYYYNHTQRVADVNHPTTNAATTDSGAMKSSQSSAPGIQGAPGSTNGPADTSSSTGASTGTSGTNPNIDKTTVPSQDSTGVKGAEGGKNGPAPNAPKQ
jgi:cytoskeletal protein RodZ